MTEISDTPSTAPCGVNPRLLELLICPATGGPLVFDKDACELISKQAKLAYPIRDGVPVMLETEARSLQSDNTAQ